MASSLRIVLGRPMHSAQRLATEVFYTVKYIQMLVKGTQSTKQLPLYWCKGAPA